MDAMYALRGYLGHGLLKSCLQSRHRVQFGVCHSHPKGKRMAIPFRANNVPAERSEFKQPDVAIIYTCLSYFTDGLTLEQVRESLTLLLSLGSNAQSFEYNLWLGMDCSHIPADIFERIDHVNKIDISNQGQLVEIHKYFGLNMNTISFWLKFSLFPKETPVHTESIQRTPWDLCSGVRSGVRGFSGTNDSRFLLPLHVRQESFDEIPDQDRKSSSGKMIHLLLEKCSRLVSLPPSTMESATLEWKNLLVLATELETHALIDTGALLTGVSNVEAADFLLSLSNLPFRGVVYFDPLKKSWMVKSRSRQLWALHASPIKPADCFTIFDESRCRGADIVLRSTAIGLVTLGPKMTKDKLMQGLGRLRMLDRTQSLILVGSDDVTNQICQRNSITRDLISPGAVIQWVIENTLHGIRDGLVEWGLQGAHYCHTHRDHGPIAVVEEFSCREFYAERNFFNSSLALYKTRLGSLLKMLGGQQQSLSLSPMKMEDYLTSIQERIIEYDEPTSTLFSTNFEQECERELEQNKETEVETQIQIIHQTPAEEKEWNYSLVSRWKTEDYLLNDVIMPLAEVLQTHVEFQTLCGITWPTNLYCTRNFIYCLSTTAAEPSCRKLNNYLRPVDALLCVGQDIILISERELNCLLPHFWTGAALRSRSQEEGEQKREEHRVQLTNLSFLSSRNSSNSIPLSLSFGPTPEVGDLSILALQVFNGEAMYGERKSLLSSLLTEKDLGKKNAIELVSMRGKTHQLDKSDLDFFEVD
jgi:hypothetical protein